MAYKNDESVIPARMLLNALAEVDIKSGTDMIYDDFMIKRSKYENALLAINEYQQRKSKVESHPPFIILGVTNQCNLHCAFCPVGQRHVTPEKGMMDFGLFTDIIDQTKNTTISVAFNFGGEPFLYNRILDAVRYASDNEIATYISSNFSRRHDGTFFNELIASGLSIIHFDIDGMTQETYSKYRVGGNLDLVKKNLETFVKVRSNTGPTTKLEVAMLVNRYNEHEVDEFKAYCDSLGVDKCLVSRMKLDPNTSLDWLPENPDYFYENYIDDSVYAGPPECPRCYFVLVVDWNGEVQPCCITYGSVNKVGDARKERLSELWNNENFLSIRDLFAGNDRAPKTVCHYCKNRLGSRSIPRLKGTTAISLPQEGV